MQQRGTRHATLFCVAKPNWPSLVLSDWRRVPNVFFWLGRRNRRCVGCPALQLTNLGPTSNFVNRLFDPSKAIVARGNFAAARPLRVKRVAPAVFACRLHPRLRTYGCD